MNFFQIAGQYFQLGITHVIPLGFDHILFIICLTLLSSNLKSLILQCSVFTLAHFISLLLASANIIKVDPAIVEPLIAFSILIMAMENILRDKVRKGRIVLIFLFGLIHGLGFATALKEIGVPANYFITSLLFFNFGVETAQVLVVFTVYFFLIKKFREKVWYKERIVYPFSSMIGCVALYWMVQRIWG